MVLKVSYVAFFLQGQHILELGIVAEMFRYLGHIRSRGRGREKINHRHLFRIGAVLEEKCADHEPSHTVADENGLIVTCQNFIHQEHIVHPPSKLVDILSGRDLWRIKAVDVEVYICEITVRS